MTTRLTTRETYLVWDDASSTVYELWMTVGDVWVMRVVPFDRKDERSVHRVNESDPFAQPASVSREEYVRIYNETINTIATWSLPTLERQLAETHIRLYALKNEMRARDKKSNTR